MLRFTLLLIVLLTDALCSASKLECGQLVKSYGLSYNFNETVAHAIHSMTVQGLQIFNEKATVDNMVPTVNHKLKSEVKVLPYAPDDSIGSSFASDTMNIIDKVLSGLGGSNDGLGANWSPIERVVHNFHMWDLWVRIHEVFMRKVVAHPPSPNVCACLTDTKTNGIENAVRWVAEHYESGTPITLLNRPIPKLSDATSWAVWKGRLLHYYTPEALYDAASYLYCVTKGL